MKRSIMTLIALMTFTTSFFANAQTMVGNDKDIHGCIASAGYVWNETSQKCERPWEAKVYTTSADFLAAEWQTCKIATDGCNTIHIMDGQLWATTEMYCEDTYGDAGKEQWSCKDTQLEDMTIWFLSIDEQAEYKEIKSTLSAKNITKVENAVNAFGDKVLSKTNYDMKKAYVIMDKTIERVQMHLMTSKYANQNTYHIVRLLRFELMILKNRWEQNTGTSSSN